VQNNAVRFQALDAFVDVVAGVGESEDVGEIRIEVGVDGLELFLAEDGGSFF
jgi:hypothetical protein